MINPEKRICQNCQKEIQAAYSPDRPETVMARNTI